MASDTSSGLLDRYERLLWSTMSAIGITNSIQRKVLTATVLQFGATVLTLILGIVIIGFDTFMTTFTPLEMSAFAVVFALSLLALGNTILILHRDFIEPICEMQTVAESVANGELDRGLSETDQPDEIGALVRSFADMRSYLMTVSAQAAALSREQFDAPILERTVPGSFGNALERMETNLRERIEDLETQQAEIEARNRELTDTAESFTRTISRVGKGDLTERLDEDVDDEVMAAVATSFNEMVAEWESMMGELVDFSRAVAEQSQQVRTNATEVQHASENISESVQEISDGVDQESRRLETASEEAENLSATIEEITASADTVAQLSDRTAAIGTEGREAAEDAEREMAALDVQSDAVTATVEELNRTIEEISDITDVILSIADQTNILALNAGIEAARAEAGGEGFAVVAEEVKSLAQETKESAEEIEVLIDEVQEQSTEAVEEIREMRERVGTGAETVETATDAFARMAENVGEINTSINEVNDATAEQAESMQDVVAMVEEIATISDQTAAEAETVAAAAQEQVATLNQVAENTVDLAEDAEGLESSLRRFEVDVDSGGTARADVGAGNESARDDGRIENASVDGASATDIDFAARSEDGNGSDTESSGMVWKSVGSDGVDAD